MSPAESVFHFGTSGWSHRDWVGTFYPHDITPADYLAAYARCFNTVEIESTWYDIPNRRTVDAWYTRTPAGFSFSPCLPRAITHEPQLQHIQPTLQAFLEVMSGLKDKLGPILVQLPEQLRVAEHSRLETLLDLLPSELAFAIEFRHGSWFKDTTFQLLESYGVAWVIVDAPFLPRVARVTAPFTYIRWHGYPGVEHRSRRQTDPAGAFRPWLPILRDLARQTPHIYGYVRNSFSGYAPRDCETLAALIGNTAT